MLQDGASMDVVVKRGRRRWILTALVILVLGIFAAAYLYPSLSRWAAASRSIDLSRLRLGQVTRGDLLRDVAAEGSIVAADHPTLVSPSQGVVSLTAKAGDVVRRGSILARIASPELENRIAQERSTLGSMKAELERLKIVNRQTELRNQQEISLLEVKLQASNRALERARLLFEQRLGSQIDAQKAEDDVRVATLELEHARQSSLLAKETMRFETETRERALERQSLIVDDVERRILELAIVSPVDGLVSRVDVKDKDTVQPNQALFSVVDLSKFEVEVQIPENYAGEIAPGGAAVVVYEGAEYPGRVKSLSPEVRDSQVKGVVEFSQAAPPKLKENQRVSTRLILDSRTNVLKVPRGPFLESMGGRQAYVVKDGLARLRPITVGTVSVTEVEITSGLAEGESIILSDLTFLEGAQTLLLRE
jgi:HlyD family secretion protein